MRSAVHRPSYNYAAALFLYGFAALASLPGSRAAAPLRNSKLSVAFNPQNGSYEIRAAGLEAPVLESHVGAEFDHRWVQSGEYPRHQEAQSAFKDELGSGQQDTITFTGLDSKPTSFARCVYTTIFPTEQSR